MVKRLSADERRAELKQYIDSVGVLHLNKRELGKRFGVSDVQIGKDIKLIMSDSKPGDVTLILKKFDSAFQLALNRALKSLSEAQGNKEVNDSIRTLIVVIQEHLSNLSKLGYRIESDINEHPAKLTRDQINEFFGIGKKTDKEKEKNIMPEDQILVKTLPDAQDSPTEEEEDDLVPYDGTEDDEEEGSHA